MWCWLIRGDLTALLDGELGPRRTARVLRHLEGCADCAAEYREIQGCVQRHRQLLGEVVRSTHVPDVDLLWDEVRRRVREVPEASGGWGWGPLAAGAVVAAALGLFFALRSMEQPPIDPPVRVVPQLARVAEEPGDARGLRGEPSPSEMDRTTDEGLAEVPREVVENPEFFVDYGILVRLDAFQHFDTVVGVPEMREGNPPQSG